MINICVVAPQAIAIAMYELALRPHIFTRGFVSCLGAPLQMMLCGEEERLGHVALLCPALPHLLQTIVSRKRP